MKKISKLILFIFIINIIFVPTMSYAYVYPDVSLNDIKTYLSSAEAGDTIKISDGIYTDIKLNINASGTKENPIVIKPYNEGGVILTGDCHIDISGKYVTLSGFYFKDAKSVSNTDLISIKNGEGIRITDCFFEGASGNGAGGRIILISDNSSYNRIDHCTFYDSKSIGIGIYAYDDPNGKLSNVLHNKIDNNYFKKVRGVKELYPDKSNGLECLQVGVGGNFELYTEVSYNLFEDCKGDGAEIISNKSSYNTYKFNTFLNNPSSTFCIRSGNNNVVYGNYFINMKDGVRAYGKNNIIANNYFYQIKRNSIVLSASDGEEYDTPKDYLVANNTIINPYYAGISIGEKLNQNSIISPENIRVVNNYILSEKGKAILNKSGKNVTFENNIQRVSSGALSDVSPYITDEYKFRRNIRMGNGNVKIRTIDNSGESYFNGEIFIPKNEGLFSERGIFIPEISEIDSAVSEGKTDIGIYRISKEEGRRGIITTDTAGPTDKWWLEVLEDLPGDYNKYEPQEKPVSYTPFSQELYLKQGEKFNIYNISGYAEYADGGIYNVNRNELELDIVKNSICELDENIIIAKSIGETSLDISYRGITENVKISVIPENSYFKYSFDNEKEDLLKISGSILSEDGKIKLLASANAVSNRGYLSGSYTISAEASGEGVRILAGYNGNASYGKLSGYNSKNNYYYIEFGGVNAGIYRYNGISAFKEGEINADFSDGEAHCIRVDISDNFISAYVDEKFSGACETDEEIKGRIGIGSSTNTVIADNLQVVKLNREPANPTTSDITTTVTGLNEVSFSLPEAISDNIIYKLKRDGFYVSDFKKDETIKDDNIHPGNSYSYNISGYDNNGDKVYNKEFEFSFDKIPDNIFYVSDVSVKCGENNTWAENVYSYSSDGIAEGSSLYTNRVYAYTAVPEELEGCPYIMTNYDHRKLNIAKNSSEWLKFTVHNSSFEIYVIIYSQTPPQWITDGEWTKTDYVISAETGSLKYEDAIVYKKEYSVENKSSTEVVLGGFGNASTYGIIIKNK